jgi:hypothetical protein
VGGPALSGYSAFWLSPFLTNPKTAPYVDFVSYHQYLFGNTQLQTQWDTYTGNVSLYQGTQDPSNGAFANYNKVLTEVATGNQPLGARTPIYITEFNTNWAFYKDCCRDDPTYAEFHLQRRSKGAKQADLLCRLTVSVVLHDWRAGQRHGL